MNSEEKKVIEKISNLGNEMISSISSQNAPKLRIPTRTLTNVHFDESIGQLKLGDKTFTRQFLNTAHTKKFMQTMLISARCKKLVEEKRHASIREMYYQLKHSIGNRKENTFEGQDESDNVIEDLEVLLNILREELNLNAKKRGSLYGDVTLNQAGDIFNCSSLGRGGWSITSNVEDIEIHDINASFALVIETDAMYERLVEEKFYKKHNALLIATEGQAPRGVRRLIHRLNSEHNLPIIVFTDGDPYGWYIYSVIKQGSINLAHMSKWLSTPKCQFIGMTMSDIDTYGLKNVTEKLKDTDIKRIEEVLKYPWFNNSRWQKEFKLALNKKIRIEQQALSNKSLEFVAEKYLPEKIENEDFLP